MKKKGFTLMELMVVIVILGLLATVVIVNVVGRVGKAKQDITKTKIRQIEEQIQLFRMDNNRLPATLDELVNRPADAKNWPDGGYLKETPKDAWDRDFIYKTGEGKRGFIIISYGADGQPGGDGENADISSEDLK